ncbi:MAG: hypothetical protein J6K66_01090 [Clostridia bacterium]|nr:hypothetical protein [Clostridia bacterium]
MTDNEKSIGEYMDSLPEYIQENIKQSGVKIESVEQLKKIAQSIQEK